MTLKILFITRNYPPQIGGLESYSYNLINEFEKNCDVWKVTLSRPKYNLVWFLPYCFFKSFYVISNHQIDIIHLCDGFLAPLGLLLKIMTKNKVSVSIHGLDITFPNYFYQLIIPWCVSRLDKVFCVSRSTRNECVRRGILAERCEFIPNGVAYNDFYTSKSFIETRHLLEKIVKKKLNDKKILLTVGRLVKRKGVSWFVEKIMPLLKESYVYIIAGDGPEYDSILDKIKQHKLSSSVFMMGKVSNELRNLAYNGSDIFVMPNVTLKDDVEGFGIVAIEAGCCGLPVVASNIQGIRDAVLDGKTGLLVAEESIDEFLEAILSMRLGRDLVKFTVINNFAWSRIVIKYRKVMEGIHSV